VERISAGWLEGEWIEGTTGPELQGENLKAADMPRYLTIVNAHQGGRDSINAFVIGIVRPRVRLMLVPVRRPIPLELGPISIRKHDRIVTIKAHFLTFALSIGGDHHKSRLVQLLDEPIWPEI
jgi:hypothetical protein